MPENIIGIMWNRNEGDILHDIIEAALPKVDALLVADDGSTDNSLDIIKSFGPRIEKVIDRSMAGKHPEHLWTRQYLLNEVKKRFNPNETWVQIIESDTILLDTDIRQTIKDWAVKDTAVYWHMLNACRRHWKGSDSYPNWNEPIQNVMPDCHLMEPVCYTFRTLPLIEFQDTGKPWPCGFSNYGVTSRTKKRENSPLVAHYGYRGPTHFHQKYFKGNCRTHSKYTNWYIDSPEAVLETVPFFNGDWNRSKDTFELSRKGWIEWLKVKSS